MGGRYGFCCPRGDNVLHEDGLDNLHYQFDMNQLEDCAKEAKLSLLCSTHNPVGRVWQKDELLQEAQSGISPEAMFGS